ncbi:MAG TPA: glycosyltransferase family 9 protein [Bryobacteraceae bacterium]|nr:glycosyltransferase family 9 protein [Bryobacteraceae bacterium]
MNKSSRGRILVVRLGSLGDIVFTLPAVASLKQSFPGYQLTWAVEARWASVLQQNPFVDQVLVVRRDFPWGLAETWRLLRSGRYEFAVDFQGLIKSAVVATLARAQRIYGFPARQTRERLAALFYSDTVASRSAHMVDKHLDLAAGAGAGTISRVFPLPPGRPESQLPEGEFVLASPLAGWRGKQWPLKHYQALAFLLEKELGVPLVLDGPPAALPVLTAVPGALAHPSSVEGLIYATRRATAVVGVDSGPLHIAAALGKPGVGLYGPTDPARNGPYGTSLRVLRSAGVETTYRRINSNESMARISPEEVFLTLRGALGQRGMGAAGGGGGWPAGYTA